MLYRKLLELVIRKLLIDEFHIYCFFMFTYLLQVSDEEAVPELTSPVAGVILTLVSNLRHCFLTDQTELTELQNLSHYVSLLDGATTASASQSSLLEQGTGVRTVFSSSLQVVLKGLIEHIMRSSKLKH